MTSLPSAQMQLTSQALDAAQAAFYAFLGEVRPAVEAKLEAHWARKLRQLAPHGREVLTMAEAARDLTMRGGKRFRAGLLAASFLAFRPSSSIEPALEAGAALELFQSYLLIQDDWMDGDLMRRGGPSAHAALASSLGSARLGASSAMLASDLTWGFALELMVGLATVTTQLPRFLRAFCAMHEDVVVGQHLDLLGHPEDVEKMHSLKTGSYTVRGPLILGALLAGAEDAQLAAFEAYAAPVGVAFQLRDDLLGAFAPSSETGKPEGGDLRAGKQTAVMTEAFQRLGGQARAAVEHVFGREDASDSEMKIAIEALRGCGAKEAVEQRLESLCQSAATLALNLPTDSPSRTLFVGATAALRMPPSSGRGNT